MQDAAASVLTDQFAEVLERLPAGLDRLALETKAIQRKRELVDGAALLRIALARGPGGLSLPQTAAWASMLGIADLSNPGVKYRLDQATEFLPGLVERLLAAKAPGAELRWPGRSLLPRRRHLRQQARRPSSPPTGCAGRSNAPSNA
jgi:hypothetical protein